ncbi:hypothetical protein [Candidatus Thiodiazotropha sp. LNASS1]|uniref:hypothetical protein n=1 Tax=Candidatus Thiodiazotropha sp. LNASS1 TaxID=3096260 RepID=UPI0034DF46A5
MKANSAKIWFDLIKDFLWPGLVLIVLLLITAGSTLVLDGIINKEVYPNLYLRFSNAKDFLLFIELGLLGLLVIAVSLKLFIRTITDLFPDAMFYMKQFVFRCPPSGIELLNPNMFGKEFYFYNATISKGARIWMRHCVTTDNATRFSLDVSIPSPINNDVNDLVTYDTIATKIESYLVIIGAPPEDREEKKFIAILSSPKGEYEKGTKYGIIFHDTWSLGTSAMSPCMLMKHDILNMSDTPHSAILSENDQVFLDREWDSMRSAIKLLPVDEPLEYIGVWVYYFRNFKGIDAYGVFHVKMDHETNRLTAKGKAWYFGTYNNKPIVRGVWTSKQLTSIKYNKVSIIYSMDIDNLSEEEMVEDENHYLGFFIIKNNKQTGKLHGSISTFESNCAEKSKNMNVFKSVSMRSLEDAEDFKLLQSEFTHVARIDITNPRDEASYKYIISNLG